MFFFFTLFILINQNYTCTLSFSASGSCSAFLRAIFLNMARISFDLFFATMVAEVLDGPGFLAVAELRLVSVVVVVSSCFGNDTWKVPKITIS